MNASGKSPLDYWGIALRFIALLPKSPSRNKSVHSLFLGLLLLLAIPAQATATIAASKLWCEFGRSVVGKNEVVPADGCTFPTASAANEALADYYTSRNSSINPQGWSYISTGCDESTGWCGIAATNGTVVQGATYDYISSWTSCPANSYLSSATACTCNTNYVADSAGTSCVLPSQCVLPNVFDPKTGQCGPPPCKVDPLPDLPKDDLCAQSLNKGLGKDVDGKCPELDARMTGANGQIQCFANKIAATNVSAWSKIPYDGPTATIRNTAYQKHLQNIWDKMIELNNLSDPEQVSACQSLRGNVIAEKGCDSSDKCHTDTPRCMADSHCIDYRPPDYSNHPNGTAFDVPNNTINGLIRELTPLPPAPMTAIQRQQAQRFWISGWLAKPTACNLVWGGDFTKPDVIHFQLR